MMDTVEILGRVTELRCACGGSLQEMRRTFRPPPPPTHRKKRIRNKWRNQWAKRNRHLRLVGVFSGILHPPAYKCMQCSKVMGHYDAWGKNMFIVEPLPG